MYNKMRVISVRAEKGDCGGSTSRPWTGRGVIGIGNTIRLEEKEREKA